MKISYFSKIAGLFTATFSKYNIATGIFQRFYIGLDQRFIAFNISKRPFNGGFWNF